MIEHQYFREPTPHIFLPELLPPEIYEKLVFPHLEPAERGRIGRDLYEGEPGYATLMASPGWRELHRQFSSQSFVEWLLGVFAEDLERLGSRVLPEKTLLRHYVESRDTVHDLTAQIDDRDVNELFTRFDIQAAGMEYAPYVHLDRIRRLVGGVLFCSHPEQEGLRGGEFAFYRDRFFANDRRCLSPQLAKTFPVQPNSGVLFLNANTAFHGPRRTHALRGLRKWVYYSISSHQPAWIAEDSSRKRHLAFNAKFSLDRMKSRVASLRERAGLGSIS